MASLFVDTNVFLRFLTNDDPAKAKRAETLFRDAVSGKIALATSLLDVAEIIWTLESFYKLEKQDIAAKIETILNTPNLECPEASLIFMALDLYVHENIDSWMPTMASICESRDSHRSLPMIVSTLLEFRGYRSRICNRLAG